jgi:hypothetical protein
MPVPVFKKELFKKKGSQMKDLIEKLSWKQIVEKYPDEWVLLDDYEPDVDFDGKGILAGKGKVLVHSAKRQDFDKKTKKIKIDNAAIMFTGDPTQPHQKHIWKIATS